MTVLLTLLADEVLNDGSEALKCKQEPFKSILPLADPGGGGVGGSNPTLKNNAKGFNPKYKIISREWC